MAIVRRFGLAVPLVVLLVGQGCSGADTSEARLGRTSARLSVALSSPATVTPRDELAFTFSEPMSPSSVEAALSFTPAIACHFAWNAERTQVRCGHLAELAPATSYVASISGAARSAAGIGIGEATMRFATGASVAASIVHVQVGSSTPASRTAAIVLTFSSPMDHASTEAAVHFPRDRGMTGAFAWNAASTELTFTPAQRWAEWVADPVSQIDVDTTARDAARYPIREAFHTTFRVGPEKTTATVLSGCPFTLSPAAGATPSASVSLDLTRTTWISPQAAIVSVTVTNLHEAENGALLLDGVAPIARIPTANPDVTQLRYEVSTKVLTAIAQATNPLDFRLAYEKPWAAGATGATTGSACSLAARGPS